MTSGSASITKRLIVSVLVLELLAGVALVAAVAMNERHVQYKAFDANLRASSSALLGDVQEGFNDSVRLDLGGRTLGPGSVFRVTDEHGRLLGSAGKLPLLPLRVNQFQSAKIDGRFYRFFTLDGEKIIDPWEAGGIHHHVTIVYGLPDGHVWHEVIEAIRFFAICTALLLGITALLLVWLVRKLLAPIHALAHSADEITPTHWRFDAPSSASRFVELRPLAAAIEKTIARLERSFEQQKRFTSDAAHELKTDLAIVKSSLQLLSMKTRTSSEYERGLDLALDDLGRLERTVQKMLTLARLEHAESPGGQQCHIDEMLRNAVQNTGPLADLRSICFAATLIEPAIVPLDGTDARLLCFNIVSNAVQHSPEHSVVEVTARVQVQQVVLSIRDHGEGIREIDASLLFEPFYRGDLSRSRKSGGTGLGLSICKAICDRVGGSITIENHRDGGAIVIVSLPVVPQEREAQAFPLTEEGFSIS